MGRFTTAFLLFASALRAAEPVSADAQLLERTGERVKRFWDQLSSVASTENVLQEKLNPKGKVILNNRVKYDYLITLRWDNGGMLVDESRLQLGQTAKKAPQGTLLTTQGFATLLMVFHPQFQASYAFTMQGAEEAGGRKLQRIGFVARNGAASPAVLAIKNRDYPILWEGTAWVDAQLAIVTRMEAHWKEPPTEIGLQQLSSEVQYAAIPFKGQRDPFWLPTTAKIEVKTEHQHWRNTHEFSGHRLFSVEADSKVEDAKGVDSKTADPKAGAGEGPASAATKH